MGQYGEDDSEEGQGDSPPVSSSDDKFGHLIVAYIVRQWRNKRVAR